MRAYRNKTLAAIFSLAILFTSCDALKNANKSQKGAAIGAAGGAVLGGVIGNNVGDGDNTALGAIIGGVVGGAAGAYIGNRMDQQAQDIENAVPGAEVTRVGEGINVSLDESSGVHFALESYSLNSQAQSNLNELIDVFKKYPKTVILIEGHTDSSGAADYNMMLSKNRAQSVTNYLIDSGIDASRLTTKWYGETQPEYDNSTAAGRAKNRRVELAIVASEQLIKEAKRKTN